MFGLARVPAAEAMFRIRLALLPCIMAGRNSAVTYMGAKAFTAIMARVCFSESCSQNGPPLTIPALLMMTSGALIPCSFRNASAVALIESRSPKSTCWTTVLAPKAATSVPTLCAVCALTSPMTTTAAPSVAARKA